MDFESIDFSAKKVLIRVDFNVPLKNGSVSDRNRIKAAVPTIKRILDQGGSVILMSHLGRPKGERKQEFSLSQIVEVVSEEVGRSVEFVDDCIGEKVEEKIDQMRVNSVLLLENLRFYAEEEKGDREFAEKLSRHANIYVNDALGLLTGHMLLLQ